ncbi:hypothetical protein C0Q70_10391 [Pomacea canaliculata]|uniref:Uncharacterized protein n=1 Tax=Pomacea canaliculata TaxID=400727 RepID=A0A2T7PCG4_POMCA|nr:hypothetical protein C0Q70_10391 [Pomacea canaliculata]
MLRNRDLPSKSEGKLLSFSYETQIFEQRRKTSMIFNSQTFSVYQVFLRKQTQQYMYTIDLQLWPVASHLSGSIDFHLPDR